ncbi:hypothetical protein NUW58_g7465 [Xylaria curta]|uniref:Uncharacterized protein n=1 Tax=Xylaria curta TaxID=42375 RepID=A0ACC1NHI7_9PEZI|nr:hypothetical protein NUW58_g7465 [Xylaria curta]
MTIGIQLKEYVYSRLATTHKTIRLLKILSKPQEPTRISLREVSLSSPPPYHCLSYTWGDPLDHSLSAPSDDAPMSGERNRYVESEDGSFIWITENLVDALQQMSRNQSSQAEGHISSWWIDAICINQEDVGERSSQVAVMDTIYYKAQSVLIWLGKEDENTETAIRILKSFARVSPALIQTPESFHSFNTESFQIVDALYGLFSDLGIKGVYVGDLFHYIAFLQRTWFTRIWVVQESFFSAATTVFCGEREIAWSTIQESSRVLYQTGLDTLLKAYVRYATQDSLDVGDAKLPDNRLSNQMIFGLLKRDATTPISLAQLLYYSRYFEATNPRDKVYAVLGLWRFTRGNRESQVEIWPDYTKSISEVYIQATVAAIHESGNLDILSLVEGHLGDTATEVPSWVPDYSQGRQVYPLVELSMSASLSRGSHAGFKKPEDNQTRSLPVDGVEIDRIEEVGPTYGDVMNEFGLISLLNLLLTYPTIQPPTSETPCEAFWRTLIKNEFHGKQAGKEARAAFPAFVMQRIRETRHQVQRWKEKGEALMAEELKAILQDTERAIETLSSRYSEEKVIPSLLEIAGMVQVEEGEEGSPEEQKLESGRKDIEESFRVAYFGRRLFRTTKGYFGIASQSVMSGDTVWILRGAKVPLYWMPWMCRRGSGGLLVRLMSTGSSSMIL